MAGGLPRIRVLVAGDAPACDAVGRVPHRGHHFPETSETTWMAVHAGRPVGFVPARELPDQWPDDKALLLAMPL